MLFDDSYRTIAQPSTGLFKDKGSKFISYAFPVKSEAEMKECLQQIKAEHPKARHHCWALRLSPDRTIYRVNDDGEPGGSAGRPILNTILSADLTDIGIIVVRYFGGTLLGIPGLIHAYKAATVDALNKCAVVEKQIMDTYQLRFNYIVMNDVMRMIKEEGLTVISQLFETECSIVIAIRQSNLNRILGKIEKIDNLTYTYQSTV